MWIHREDGPAVEHVNGYKAWYLNGQLHREAGPAVEHVNGYKEWYLNGVNTSEKLINSSLDGKVIEIDGIKYKLNKV